MQNNNHEWLKRCFNCMEPIDSPDAVCANCGWDNHNRENGNAALEQMVLKDQYIVGKSLGRGGFGITYVGFDLTLERRVAIKEYFPVGMAYRFSDAVTVRAYTEAEEDYKSGLEQALQESRTIAKLGQIPNIMQVHNAFLENGTVYMVMEYIDGNSLAEEVKQKGRMGWKEALHLLYPIMDALEKIHEKGMIHRDISPENIIRRRETGEPVLLDFGSARPQREGLTVMLKPGYAPMEQYSTNSEQDGRVDEYALCATMYFLVTGNAPVSADLRQFAKKELKRPSEYAEDIPVGFEEVLMKGMEPESGDRYSSVRKLHEAFLEVEQEGAGERRRSGGNRAAVSPGGFKNSKDSGDYENSDETGRSGNTGNAAGSGNGKKPSESGSRKPEKKKNPWEGRKIAGAFVGGIAVACLAGFLLFGNAGRDKDAKKEAVESAVEGNMAEEAKTKNEATPVPAGPPKMRSESEVDYDNRDKATVLGSKVLRSEITEVKIEKSLSNAPSNAWDVSEAGDRSVLAWVTETSGGKTLTIAGEGGMSAPEDSTGLFYYYVNLQKVDLNGLDTSNVTHMEGMFSSCSSLTSLDLSNFNTSNVTDMGGMFDSCSDLTSLDVSNFNTSNVTYMGGMFSSCSGLTSLDVSKFDTSNVTDMSFMFYSCSSLTSLNVSNFDTTNVTDMSRMFEYCENLTSIGTSDFDTSQADTTDMFYECEKLWANGDISQ